MLTALTTTVNRSEDVLAEYDLLKDIPWLGHQLFGNSLHAYILTAISFLVLWGVLRLVRRYLLTRVEGYAKGEEAATWAFCQRLLEGIRPYLFPLVAFYAATKRLSMPGSLDKGIHLLTTAVLTITAIRMASQLVAFLLGTAGSHKSEDPAVRSANSNIVALIEIGLWIGGVLFYLDNAGFNVSTFIAGLGIGGVAIALAAQAILGDTFSSFAIALDKPFEVGDFINVDAMQGTVEHIGLKTTRVRSVGGELLVFANSDLTKSRIRNFKRMYHRRATFKINVHPATPLDKVRRIPDLLGKVVEVQPETTLDRSNFISFGDTALIFEVVYAVKRPDYKLFVDTQQAINLGIAEAFAREGIQMAYAAPAPLVPLP